jgi:hypothetical protein
MIPGTKAAIENRRLLYSITQRLAIRRVGLPPT